MFANLSAGCRHFLVLSGTTFASRLWCCVERFVYMSRFVEGESREAPIVLTISADEHEHERVCKDWLYFDAAACECSDPEDKTQIFAVTEQHPGGVQGFNAHAKTFATGLFESCASRAYSWEHRLQWRTHSQDGRCRWYRRPRRRPQSDRILSAVGFDAIGLGVGLRGCEGPC